MNCVGDIPNFFIRSRNSSRLTVNRSTSPIRSTTASFDISEPSEKVICRRTFTCQAERTQQRRTSISGSGSEPSPICCLLPVEDLELDERKPVDFYEIPWNEDPETFRFATSTALASTKTSLYREPNPGLKQAETEQKELEKWRNLRYTNLLIPDP